MKTVSSLVLCALIVVVGSSAWAQPTTLSPDGRFLVDAANSGMRAMEMSRLAAEKASRPEVKALAKTLLDDHTMVSAELSELARRKTIDLPTELSAEHRAERDQLGQLSGSAFDDAYLRSMFKAQEKTVGLFIKESGTGADADTKVWAAKITPRLQAHLSELRELGGSRY